MCSTSLLNDEKIVHIRDKLKKRIYSNLFSRYPFFINNTWTRFQIEIRNIQIFNAILHNYPMLARKFSPIRRYICIQYSIRDCTMGCKHARTTRDGIRFRRAREVENNNKYTNRSTV